VLAAGFVGYFVNYLAMIILDKVHKGRPETSNAENTGTNNRKNKATFNENSYKLEKKKAKQETKRAKKDDNTLLF
jgi:hypothetical protein